MADFNIRVSVDKRRAKDKVDKVYDALTPLSLTESMGDGADVFVDRMREFAPHDTGYLEGSIDKKLIGPTEWEIGPEINYPVIYAALQNFGGVIEKSYYMTFEYQGRHYHTKAVSVQGSEYVSQGFISGREEAIETVVTEVLRKAIT